MQDALAGAAATNWFAGSVEGNSTIVAAVPLRGAAVRGVAEAPFGAGVLEQTSDEILIVRNEVLASLLGWTLIATIVVSAFLLGYATRLCVARASARARGRGRGRATR